MADDKEQNTKSVDAVKDCEIQMKIGTIMLSVLREEVDRIRREISAEFEASSNRLRSQIRALESKMEFKSTNPVESDDVVEENDKNSMEQSIEKKNGGRSMITRFVFFISFTFNGQYVYSFVDSKIICFAHIMLLIEYFVVFFILKLSFSEQQRMVTESEELSVGSRSESMNGRNTKKRRRRRKKKNKAGESQQDSPPSDNLRARRYVFCLCIHSVLEYEFE